MQKKIDLSLILACFNEGPTLIDSLKKITEILESTKYSWEIIAIDDCSGDSTYKVLRQFSRSRKNIRVFGNSENLGRGGTVFLGIQKAVGKITGFIDVDLEVSAVYIPQFVAEIKKGADLAVANRIYKESLSSVSRWVLSKGYNVITRHFLNLDIKDTEAGYKFFNTKSILDVVKKTRDKKWFFDTEIVALAVKKKLKIVEIPVLFLRRDDKKSTVKIVPDTLAYLKAVYKYKNKK